jgi:Uma2 family endonuclease
MTTLAAKPPAMPPTGPPGQPVRPAAAPVPTQPPPMLGARPVRKFTVDEYHRLIADGFFNRDDHYELLDGYIVQKMSRDPIHDACVALARRILDGHLPSGWHIRVQSAVTTADSEPEPDLAVVRGIEIDYVTRHPGPPDAALIVEIANTSAGDDRATKGPLYARAGFAAYWILNIRDRRIEAYSDPSGPDPAPAYRRREDYVIGKSVPLNVGDASVTAVPVTDLLPPQPAQP